MEKQANELRIENLVYDTEGDVNTVNTNICQVKPSPLTEERLVELGLKYKRPFLDMNGYCFPNSQKYRVLKRKDKFYFMVNAGTTWQSLTVLESDRQLQNLYSALTGKELTT